ncbi:MAG: signal peptide peptidase SppA [Firmicutes bacterium]|nr:signal peptide peptidase SppA [Bacillota bacterium]
MDNFDKDQKQVQYYSNGQFSSEPDQGASGTAYAPRRKKIPTWIKALIIIAAVVIGVMFVATACSNIIPDFGSDNTVSTGFGHDYIGTVHVEGTIDESGGDTYNHQYLLNAIDAMIADGENKGMILYVNTPGGSVFASDELYLKIREYQEVTGRPVYTSMQSQATSGGYYISASSDKIFANRNCWTGSLGVTMGSFYDISGLLDKLGIKTTTITAGEHKAMGSSTDGMSDDERAIFQSLVDEAYEQFVGIISEGRGMTTEEVKALADGRIYSAKQALDNGLIDSIGTYEETIEAIKADYDLGDIAVEEFQPEPATNLSSFFGIVSSAKDLYSLADKDAIEELLELNGTFKLSYICEVRK